MSREARKRLCALGFTCWNLGRANASRPNEIFVPQFPGNAEGVQDVPLGGLSTRTSLFDGMDRSRRNIGTFREVILGPTKGLSSGADAIHGGNFSGLGAGFRSHRFPATIAPVKPSGVGHSLQVVDSQGAFRSSSCESIGNGAPPRRQ